jgi:2-C-methyl-D-erythritol 4-phosphate cytidylyltransferase/2-C-methyl-D-erythritol 2,4-cyclodiphosphate synthase
VRDITLILLGAGNSSRFEFPFKKQWLWSGDKPLWLNVADEFKKIYSFNKIIIVSSKDDILAMSKFAEYEFITGGDSRQESLKNGLSCVDTPFVLVSDIARCCLDKEMIKRVISLKKKGACVVPTLKPTDTLYLNSTPLDRNSVKIIQTPQLSCTSTLKKALNTTKEFTDDSSAISMIGGEIIFTNGSIKAHKLTTKDDLEKLDCLKKPSNRALIGFGVDIHPFEENKRMYLCGVEIDSKFGFKAHSDGDVAIHAIIDALLGASGLGDIGELFPDTSSEYKNIRSTKLLEIVKKRLTSFGYVIGNIDITIIAQTPKLMEYKRDMRFNLAKILALKPNLVNIKATTAEKLGWIGRKEGVAVEAIATLYYFDWTEK